MNLIIRYSYQLLQLPRLVGRFLRQQWQKNLWNKVWLCIAGLFLLFLSAAYGIARWYIANQNNKPYTMGTTFIPAYAESLGLQPEQTLDAILGDLNVKHLRLVSYWDQMEPNKGTYDFSQLDWQMQKAEEHHAKVSLSIGLRQPRWPECHMPSWAVDMPKSQWQPQLNQFIGAVIDRYKNSPSLDSYQLENEYFLSAFGTCTDFSRNRLVSEYNLVKKHDNKHTVIITRSNNALGLSINDPRPDVLGVSIYKRVWSPLFHRYLEYPFPAWFYGFMAGTQKIVTGTDMIIHELQAEAWPPNAQSIPQTSLAEQSKSFDARRFKDRIAYGKATGIHTMYLWGSEYWYYRLVVLHDDSLWNVAKDTYRKQ